MIKQRRIHKSLADLCGENIILWLYFQYGIRKSQENKTQNLPWCTYFYIIKCECYKLVFLGSPDYICRPIFPNQFNFIYSASCLSELGFVGRGTGHLCHKFSPPENPLCDKVHKTIVSK